MVKLSRKIKGNHRKVVNDAAFFVPLRENNKFGFISNIIKPLLLIRGI